MSPLAIGLVTYLLIGAVIGALSFGDPRDAWAAWAMALLVSALVGVPALVVMLLIAAWEYIRPLDADTGPEVTIYHFHFGADVVPEIAEEAT